MTQHHVVPVIEPDVLIAPIDLKKEIADQEEFDEMFVTAAEICQRLEVTRAAIVYARKKQILPTPIIITGMNAFLWKREEIEPYLIGWHKSLMRRRNS